MWKMTFAKFSFTQYTLTLDLCQDMNVDHSRKCHCAETRLHATPPKSHGRKCAASISTDIWALPSSELLLQVINVLKSRLDQGERVLHVSCNLVWLICDLNIKADLILTGWLLFESRGCRLMQ